MFKFMPLFFANFGRKPVRTGLTVASILVAFMLFGLLKTMQAALSLGSELTGVDRLITIHRMSLAQLFPRSYLARVEAMEGVAAAASFNWFGGTYQDDRNQIGAQSTDPDRFFQVYREYSLPEEQKADWIRDRGSMIVGVGLAQRFGWKVGDIIPLRSVYYQRTDGTNAWDFRIAGIFEAGNGDTSSAYFHWEYLNESIGSPDLIGFVGVRVNDSSELSAVAKRIDAQFANSPSETKTDSERAFVQGFANQMGDIGAIVTAVVSAVFFTILLVAGNTMAQSVRERTSELAVLKTLGFSNGSIMALVLAEAFLITVIGGVLGLGLATLFAEQLSAALQQFFPQMGMPFSTFQIGAVLIVLLSVAAALLPCLQAGRLKITDALRRA